jgi:hypothetical protein
MSTYKELIEKCIFENSLALLAIDDVETLVDIYDNYLPYTTGFEIECSQNKTFKIEHFKAIPDIVEVNVDSWEQRFQIPAGIKGLICLWNICEQLKLNSLLNEDSGIHIHVDMTGFSVPADTRRFRWMLDELDSWNYKGSYNNRNISISKGNWVRVNTSFKTIEFRICEMTFDYNVLIKRIIHVNSIVKRLKREINSKKSDKLDEINALKIENVAKDKILNYIKHSADDNRIFLSTINSINEELKDLLKKPEELIKVESVTNLEKEYVLTRKIKI